MKKYNVENSEAMSQYIFMESRVYKNSEEIICKQTDELLNQRALLLLLSSELFLKSLMVIENS